ncbi:MAG: hypothetical protein SPE03_12230 [Treponema sp.]|nr:hypothetical protein [Treponema sp.]
MKKIVGILAVAAMATSMFAAEVAGNLKLNGKLANFDGDNFTLLHAPDVESNPWGNQTLKLSVNADVAGAAVDFLNRKKEVIGANWNIWFKPADMVKLTVGNLGGYELNSETINYTNLVNNPGWGYVGEVNVDAFSLAISTTSDKWLGKDNEVPNLYLRAGYAADFGKIQAAMKADNTFKKLQLAAGFTGSADSISYFADVLFGMDSTGDKTVNTLLADAFLRYGADALEVKAYLKAGIPMASGAAFTIAPKAYVGYQLDACKVSCVVDANTITIQDGADLLTTIKVTPKVEGNLGGMGWEVSAEMSIPCAEGKKFTVGVPFGINMNF